jgi:hypothetical protein
MQLFQKFGRRASVMNKKQIFVVIVVVVLVLVAGGWGLYEYQRKAKLAEERAIERVCDGRRMPDAATYNAGAGVHPLVFVEVGNFLNQMDSYTYTTPDEWRFKKIKELEMVVCIEEDDVGKEIQTCSYTLENGKKFNLVRVQRVTTVRLVAAQTGEVIAVSDEILGDMPAECAETISVKESEGSGQLKKGRRPSRDEIVEWVKAYAETQ